MDCIEIFTDGSCHTQKRTGAWAAIIKTSQSEETLTGVAEDTTHNRMELLAVINAIAFVTDRYPGASIVIYTDSQYVEKLPGRKEKLKRNNFFTKKGIPNQNADLVRNLILQMESYKVTFLKVKAHQNPLLNSDYIVSYNIKVDKLVRELVRSMVKQEFL